MMSVDGRVTGFLKQRMGLDAATIGESALERAVRQRQQSTGQADFERYWLQLQGSGREQQALIEAVVVPETWFYRYPESFTALAELAVKRLAGLHRPLRILSAPCATGEEPYSIAMTLLDAGLAPAQFSIDALDISPQLIARASAGYYGKNSFRGEFEVFRARHFSATADGYCLNPRVRGQVRFRAANLMEPATLGSEGYYDFVFCRNVLIYFDVPTQEAVLRTLLRVGDASGYLFVGPAEASLLSRHGLQALGMPLSFAFQRVTVKKAMLPPAHAPRAPLSPPARSTVNKPAASRPPVAPPTSVAKTSLPVAPTAAPAETLDTVADLANAGRLDEALRLCRQLLDRQGPSAALFYWFGLLHDTAGRQNDALDFYRKALYLDPKHPETLAHLAALLQARGDAEGARRLQARAGRGVNKHG